MFRPVVCRQGLFIIWEILFEPPVKKFSSSFDKALEVWDSTEGEKPGWFLSPHMPRHSGRAWPEAWQGEGCSKEGMA
jgi:hypothetical protein